MIKFIGIYHIITIKGEKIWEEPIQIIKLGDVIWVPIDVKHWYEASKDIAMTHLVVTGADENGKNANCLEIK